MEENIFINLGIKEIESYQPSWNRIINTNQWPYEKTDYQAEKYKVEKFCEAIRHIRKLLNESSRKMGSTIGYSHTRIIDIENNSIMKLPIDKLEHIAALYKTSVAYLIGLTDDYEYVPNKIDLYFWEYPTSHFIPFKQKIIDNAPLDLRRSLGSMIVPVPENIDKIKEDISNSIGNNYELALSLQKILTSNSKKRYNFIKILEYLKEL